MVITDPVHGIIHLNPIQNDLLHTVEIQRLNAIHQLGMTFQVYPCAHSMRFSHALGVSYLAGRIGSHVLNSADQVPGIEDSEGTTLNLLTAAGLLHDVCHTPWSHTLEPLLHEITGRTHMDLTIDILTGKNRFPIRGAGLIPQILRDHGVEPADVAALITSTYPGSQFIQQIIFGEVDADTLDYLKRDFFFTGVSFGHIDIDRLIETMVIDKGRLYFKVKGLQAVRDFLNARVEMYSAVYLHKTTRITDMMLLRLARKSILELKEFPEFWSMTDDEILSAFLNDSRSDYVRDMAWRLKFRQDLFKRVYHIEAGAMTIDQRDSLLHLYRKFADSRQFAQHLEENIECKAGIPKGYVIVDLVSMATLMSEQRFQELDIQFIDREHRTYRFAELDRAFASYIQDAQPSRSLLSVYVPREYVKCSRSVIMELLSEIGYASTN